MAKTSATINPKATPPRRVDIRTVKAYVKLAKQKEELETRIKKVKQAMAELEDGVLEYMLQHGFQRLNILDRTLYISSTVYAKLLVAPKDLKDTELEYLVKEAVNSQSLSAHFREMMKVQNALSIDDFDMPEDLKDKVALTEKISLRVRKS